MADIQEIYSILLARGYQDQLFSDLPGQRRKESRETKAVCPVCNKDNFSYSRDKPLWRCWSCGDGGDWISYLEQRKGYTFQRALADLAEKAGVEISPHIQEGYKAYVRKADILEEAQAYFSKTLDQTGSQVFDYLTNRGYSAEEIYGMELGEHKDRKALQDHLKKAGYTDQEIRDSGLLTIGEDWPLTLLWKDQAGRAIGMAGRAISPEVEPKYKYSAGLQKDKGLVGFSSVRGSPEVIVVEGVLDALLLNYKGLKSVSLGGTNISVDQLKALETAGTKELLLALDMDQPGQKATEKMIRDLKTSSLRAYVVSLPTGYKDPDELIRARRVEVFQEALETAERSSSWMAKRIASRHDTETARGMDQALEEAGDYLSDIKDSLETKDFMASLQQATGLSREDLDSRLLEVSRTASARRAQSILENNLRDIQQKASQGDIPGAEADLSRLLDQVRLTRGVRLPEPYLMEDLTGDLNTTSPALLSGYSWLDKTAKIPVGALTIIGGRPGHGKTTLQLNLLIRMLRAYPDKRFYLFSYEEAKKALATKIIMILAGVEIQRDTNYGAYIHYLKEKRGTNKKIDLAIQEYEEITSAGRLLVSDDMYRAEDLTVVLETLGRQGETGAVFIDYLQKIPVQRPQSQRYMDIKLISELMLRQAVSQDIPIILGAQLSRASGGGAEPTLADLREGGDIEQDANLVLSLYTQAIDELQEKASGQRGIPATVETKVSVLKNRAGGAGLYQKMNFNMPIYTITEKEI
jgi:DNA primase catalytic core